MTTSRVRAADMLPGDRVLEEGLRALGFDTRARIQVRSVAFESSDRIRIAYSFLSSVSDMWLNNELSFPANTMICVERA